MSQVGDLERQTQDRVIGLLQERLGYRYLGNWQDRQGNRNIEEEILSAYLREKKGYSEELIGRALYELNKAATNLADGLYAANQAVYGLLRYGVRFQAQVGQNCETVELIDWEHPERNDFAVAEEVTIEGRHTKRPDVVLYVNGIALGVLELKRSTVSVGDGIRQHLANQQKEFIEPFFSTVQWLFAGNDTQGLRYGVINTPDKYYLQWKEAGEDTGLLDKYLLKLCERERFLEIIYDFMLFDGGIKKVCRPHQYFGVKAAEAFAKRQEGGIIWHTQGSGKTLVMVWVAKWILENNPKARVAIITDRIELDKQIERVFTEAGQSVVRTRRGDELMRALSQPLPRLLCSLVHKFGRQGVNDFDAYIEELKRQATPTVGDLFVFVDECHRTQSGKLHKAMKALLKNAVFIGFTGTPLLKADKQTSLEVFGKYIHTYKFKEAVEDEVVLDLMYEARDIDQKITSSDRIDAWFEAKTRGLNDYQKMELKKKWGTMQRVLSSRSRMEKIVSDVVFDFNVKPRLCSERGNAILVAGSIYEACRYYEAFQDTELKGKCALITSYVPNIRDITTEETGANTETEKQFLYKTYIDLLGDKTTEKYEDAAKAKFIKKPAEMRLLIVVDKLLTGFDAPPCTYLYLDKSMQDHGLFQAICRVNRLDGDDKEFGYIVDYKDLFNKVENAVSVYTGELDYDTFEKEDVDILLKNRLETGRERLDNVLEELALLCEPVEPPRDSMAYIRYFCGDPENEDDLKACEPRRVILYKQTAVLMRAYAVLSAEMEEAGYSEQESNEIEQKVTFYIHLRDEIKSASGEILDTKTYEADMRHLIDTFIQAEESRTISPFGDLTLLDIIVRSGIAEAIGGLPPGIRQDRQAVAETIENNVRRKIIQEHLTDPAYFDQMSTLLDEIIRERKANAISYEEYLKKIASICQRVDNPMRDDLPAALTTKGQQALYRNVGRDESLAQQLHGAVMQVRRADWRGDIPKEQEIKGSLFEFLQDEAEVERIFQIIKEQREY